MSGRYREHDKLNQQDTLTGCYEPIPRDDLLHVAALLLQHHDWETAHELLTMITAPIKGGRINGKPPTP